MRNFISKNLIAALLLISCALFSSCESHKERAFFEAYPTVEAVSDWFDTEVSRLPEDGKQYELIKNAKGYFLVKNEVSEGKWQHFHEPVQLWSSETRKFTPPSDQERAILGSANDIAPNMRNRYILTRNASQLNENVYFGYDEWAEDVVKDLEGNPNMDARLWYGLGRAYSYLGTAQLDGRLNGDLRHPYDSSLDPAEFKEADFERYDSYMGKAIEAFEKSAELDPNLRVIVGTVAVKAANEHMTAWMDLNIIGQGERAKSYLKPDLYPAAYVSLAKNLLNSSEPGGIIFTNGDNDTYPTLYMQAQYGLRPDVTVVNLSLLNTPRYIHYLKTMISAEQQLPITMTKSDYASDSTAFRQVDRDITLAVAPAPATMPVYEGDEMLSQVPLRTRGGRGGSYFLRQDLVLMDLIEHNAWNRPLYFADRVDPQSQLGLDKVCRNAGMLIQITPFAHHQPAPPFEDIFTPQSGANWPDPSFQLFMNKFSFDGLGTLSKDEDGVADGILLQSIKYRFHLLLEALFVAGDTMRFGQVLDKYLEVMPPESQIAPSPQMPLDAYFAENMGFSDQAKRLFRAAEGMVEAQAGADHSGDASDQGDLRTACLLAINLRIAYDKMGRPDEAQAWSEKYELLAKYLK